MTERTRKLLEEVLALPSEEQAEFFDQNAAPRAGNHHGFGDAQIAEEWDAEIARRLDDVDSGRVKTIPLEEVRERMRKSRAKEED